MVILNSDEIEKIKKNNYYNVIIDEEREKELNELYKKQNDNERLVDRIKFVNNYEINYKNANEKNKDSKIIVINNENPEKQIQKINYYERKQSNNQSKNSQSSSLNEIKKAENDSNKQESKFTPMYGENINSNNDIKKSKNEENKTPLISSITAIPGPQNNNDNINYNDINIKNTIYINNENKNKKNNEKEISSNGIGGILSNQNQYQKQPSSNSIREEIEENINNISKKVNNSQSTNKFQNVNYEDNNDYNNYNDFNNNSKFNKDQSEIEEEYNDFEDISGNFDRKQSDIDKKNKSNISISGIMKNSSIKESIAGQKRNSGIEENIERESISSNQYNDFETSNNLIKKGITGNTSSGNQAKTLSEGEIKEEINYDDDY